MATINPTSDNVGQRLRQYIWTPMLNGDVGAAIQVGNLADKTVQFLGTFSVGGTIILEGSLDGTNYETLTDPDNNAISKTAAALELVREGVIYIRPSVTAGDGSTSLTAILFARGPV